MSEWIPSTLRLICDAGGGTIQTGPFGSQLHASEYVDAGTPVVMPQDIADNTIDQQQIARVPKAVAERLARHRLEPGDIVFSRRGDVTRRSLVRELNAGWLCGTGCLRVRPGASVNSAFLSYALGTEPVREWLVAHAVGATMLNLNTEILGRLPLSMPSLREQQEIAEVLGALDDKIAANTALASTAWRLVEAEFHSVQLEVESAERRLVDVVRLEYGKALPASSRRPGSVTVVGSGGANGFHSISLVESSGVVVGRKGTAGSVHWVSGPHFPIDTTFYAQGVRDVFSQAYLYFLLRGLRLDEMNNDSAVPGLNRSEALALPVRVAPDAQLASFTKKAGVLIDLAESTYRENRTLAATRDALLPQLISGKLRVRDTEMLASVAGA